MYCSHNGSAASVQGCDEYVVYDSFFYSFNNSVVVKSGECYETKTPFAEKACVFYTYDSPEEADPVCHAEWNGQRCNSCIITNYYSHGFNCSNVEGGRVGDARRELLSIFDLCANSTCNNFCGNGSYIPEFNFHINVTAAGSPTTCGALHFYDENVAFADAICHYFVDAAQSGGCYVPINSTSSGEHSGPGPKGDSTKPPVEAGEDQEASSPPAADANKDSASACQTIASIASMTSQAAVVMVLINRV